jgi:hypothetical protein
MRERTWHTRTETEDREMDVAIWRAVRYLDSSTDYREYLPDSGQAFGLPKSEFVTLDNEQFDWGNPWVITVIAMLAGIVLLLWVRG